MATWAFIGLGNPGEQYCLNRHNIGFMVIDVAREYFKAPDFKIKQNIAITEFSFISPQTKETNRIFLVKPQTFMNLSGKSIGPLLSFFKISLDHTVVFHDELDLGPGRIKIKRGGGNGGHNGLKSLDSTISADYWRVRMGIGHPGHKDAVTGHVLSNFKSNELDGWVATCIESCAATITDFLITKDPATWIKAIQTRNTL